LKNILKELNNRLVLNLFKNKKSNIKIGKMDELNNISRELSKIKKENPFKTPDQYFDNFSARLQMKLEAEKKIVPAQKNRIITFLKPALGLAASFALIFMLVYWPLKTYMPNRQANNTETEAYDMQYINMVEEIDENSFYSLLDEPNGSAELTDDDLESYLVANVSEYEMYNETKFN
jgi:hypothetical protein